jgi:hypothetical protein
MKLAGFWRVVSLSMVSAACAAAAPGERLSFVAGPIVRDTSSVPCWLAQYRGELYFLTLQTDVSAPVNPPWLGHRVLVEGVLSAEPDICGGRVIKPLSLSVLPELDASCNTMWPAEERYNLTFEPPRPPGPSRGRLAFGDPAARNTAPAREITLQYEFDGKVAFRHAQKLQQLLDAARATHATELRITGYRSASKMSDGSVMREREAIGGERAAQVEELLRGAGLDGVRYTLRVVDRSKRPDGTNDAANRRVDVEIVGGE